MYNNLNILNMKEFDNKKKARQEMMTYAMVLFSMITFYMMLFMAAIMQ